MLLHFIYKLSKNGYYWFGVHSTTNFSEPWPKQRDRDRELIDFADSPEEAKLKLQYVLAHFSHDKKCTNNRVGQLRKWIDSLTPEQYKEYSKTKARWGKTNGWSKYKLTGPKNSMWGKKHKPETIEKMRANAKIPKQKPGYKWWTNARGESRQSEKCPGRGWWRGRPAYGAKRKVQTKESFPVWGRSN